ncbi:MAG: hypothetical protein ACJ8G7_21950, partial [Rhizobacter sp.]
PRIVYENSLKQPRDRGPTVGTFNPVSEGFQAAGYLSRTCVGAACERPVAPTDPLLRPAYFAAGEQPSAGANPNALSSSLTWLNAQPELTSMGRFEFLQTGGLQAFGNPTLIPRNGIGGSSAVLGLSNVGAGDVYKIGAGLTQTPVRATGDAPTPTRIVLAVNNGIIAGQGITMSTDGTTAFKTSLPTPSIVTADSGAAPTFSTITPTVLGSAAGASGLSAPATLPQPPLAPATLPQPPVQPPVTVPPVDVVSGTAADVASLQHAAVNAVTGSPESGATPDEAAARPVDTVADPDAPLLVLGGRGIAQTVDLGRSGGLGGARPALRPVDYEVACDNGAALRTEGGAKRAANPREKSLTPCR